MELLVRDRPDHPDFDQLLPQVGCSICGQSVQTVPTVRQLARAAYRAGEDNEEAALIREAFEAPMYAWSREHAPTHEPAP